MILSLLRSILSFSFSVSDVYMSLGMDPMMGGMPMDMMGPMGMDPMMMGMKNKMKEVKMNKMRKEEKEKKG